MMEPTSLQRWLEDVQPLTITDFAKMPLNSPVAVVAIDHLPHLLDEVSHDDSVEDNPFERGVLYDPSEIFDAVRKSFTRTKDATSVRLIHSIDSHLINEEVPAVFGDMVHADGGRSEDVLVYGQDHGIAHTGAGIVLSRYVLWDLITSTLQQIYY
jgi:hypothetical protein